VEAIFHINMNKIRVLHLFYLSSISSVLGGFVKNSILAGVFCATFVKNLFFVDAVMKFFFEIEEYRVYTNNCAKYFLKNLTVIF